MLILVSFLLNILIHSKIIKIILKDDKITSLKDQNNETKWRKKQSRGKHEMFWLINKYFPTTNILFVIKHHFSLA